MPYLNINGVEYYYEDTLRGNETIVFSHGLLWSHWMFRLQVEALKPYYRVITYDHRGQGKTEGPKTGYDMETLTDDTAKLIQELVGGPVHFAGLSMGGYIGQRLAARKPELIKTLILLDTSADDEPKANIKQYKLLNWLVKHIGFWPVEKAVMNIMFGNTFLQNPDNAWEKDIFLKKLRENNRNTIVKATEGVIYRKSILDEIAKIKSPTLILVGEEDKPAPLEKSQMIKNLIKNARLSVIPNSGHSSSLEAPEYVNREIHIFLQDQINIKDSTFQ